MDHRGRPVPERPARGLAVEAGRAQLGDEGVLGVPLARPRAAVEDRGLAGLEREGEVAAQVRRAGRPTARTSRSGVEPRLADRDDALVARPRRRSRPSRRRRPSPRRGDGRRRRRRATAGRSTSASARSRGAQVPAGDEDPLDARDPRRRRGRRSTSSSKRSALRWPWESTRRMRLRPAGFRPPRPRPREQRHRRRRSRGPARRRRPSASSSQDRGPPLPSAPYG